MIEKDNLLFENYLMKIYDQNEKIIKLLGTLIKPDALPIPPKNEIHKINIEKMNRLTSREHQIIELILEGKLNKEIAYAFSLSLSTVEAHRSNIMRKLDAKNVAQLIKIYLQCQDLV